MPAREYLHLKRLFFGRDWADIPTTARWSAMKDWQNCPAVPYPSASSGEMAVSVPISAR